MKILTLIFLCSLIGWAETKKGSDMDIKLRVGSNSFTLSLIDNESTRRFKELLPLTIRMKDLNENEKYYDLPKSIPTNASVPTKISNGDLMLYGSDTLVLFYKSFSTPYSYTKLGHVNDPAKLETALGSGDVTLTFDK